MDHVPEIELNNDTRMPQLGLGVWKASDDEAEFAVSTAIKNGYRLIDTATIYGNERGVGRGIVVGDVPRGELFVTTKLWNADQGYDRTLAAFEKSLENLNLDYVDLYLIHWPVPAQDRFVETWKAFEKLYRDGKVRAIGVSNFKPHHLEKLLSETDIVPAVNQIELHPRFTQKETREFCAAHDIRVEAWSPIGGSGGDLLSEPVLATIAQAYGKTPAQVVLRWHIQQGLIVIPKSVHEERIRENIDIFDFELTEDEMAQIRAMDQGESGRYFNLNYTFMGGFFTNPVREWDGEFAE